MTNTEIIQAIKAEIERQKYVIKPMFLKGDDNYYEGENDGYDKILSFLDTLESEKPIEQEGLEEELDRFIASGKSVTVDDYGTYKVSYHDFKKVAHHFAEWGAEQQKEQDDNELSDLLTIAHLQGAEQMKEQMMKEAAEGRIYDFRRIKEIGYSSAKIEFEEIPELNDGDKVRVIVIPKEDEK